MKFTSDIPRLTKDLTDSYTEQLLKVRAIFIWITENISYDYKFINKGKELTPPECKPGENCEQKMKDWEKSLLLKIIKKKKSICWGYARLFQTMCELAGVSAFIIEGYAKTKPYQIGQLGIVDHAWNAVLIDTAYYFLDATWAAGGCDEDESGRLKKFQKEYDNYYWFTPWQDLIRNHYPKQAKWVMKPNYTKETYANNPFYEPHVISKIRLITPGTGVVTVKKGDTIQFSFEYEGRIRLLQINSNVYRNPDIYEEIRLSRRKTARVLNQAALDKQRYVAFEQTGKKYSFQYVVTDRALYYLDILFNHERALRFHIKVKE